MTSAGSRIFFQSVKKETVGLWYGAIFTRRVKANWLCSRVIKTPELYRYPWAVPVAFCDEHASKWLDLPTRYGINSYLCSYKRLVRGTFCHGSGVGPEVPRFEPDKKLMGKPFAGRLHVYEEVWVPCRPQGLHCGRVGKIGLRIPSNPLKKYATSLR